MRLGTSTAPWIEENKKEFADRLGDDDRDREHAMRQIRKGSLQATASMLLNQNPQYRMAETSIRGGVRLLEQANAAARKRYKNVTDEETLRFSTDWEALGHSQRRGS